MTIRTRLIPLLALVCLAASTTTGVAACAATAEPSGTPSSLPSGTPRTPTPSASQDGGPATWTLAPDQSLQKSSTRFTALVSRLDCNSGVTGQVLAPQVRAGASEIVVTFFVVAKEVEVARCPANNPVPVDVDLGEPLQSRTLVDGHCLPGREAATTIFCSPDGVRYRP